MADTFMTRYAGPLVAALIAVIGVAASWGAAKSEVASLATSAAESQSHLSTVDDRVRKLEIKDGANTEILKNISEKLDSIQSDIKEIKDGKK